MYQSRQYKPNYILFFSTSPCQSSTPPTFYHDPNFSPPQLESPPQVLTTPTDPSTLTPSTTLPLSNSLPPSALLPPTPSVKSCNSSNRPSRKVDLPKPEDFYAIYQQQKRRNSLSPAPKSGPVSPNPALSSGTPSPKGSERRSLRQRSASPQCRKGVEFWEQKDAELKRGSSQERDKMSARTDVQVQGGGIMER